MFVDSSLVFLMFNFLLKFAPCFLVTLYHVFLELKNLHNLWWCVIIIMRLGYAIKRLRFCTFVDSLIVLRGRYDFVFEFRKDK